MSFLWSPAYAQPAEAYIPVQRHYQITSYYCGPASLEMVFDYFGADIPQREIADAARTSMELGGTYPFDMVRAAHFSNLSTSVGDELPGNINITGYTARKLGYASFEQVGMTFEELKFLIAAGYPIIVMTPGHYIVVVGYNSNYVTVQDPLFGPPMRNLTQDYFLQQWTYAGSWGLFVSPWQVRVSFPRNVMLGSVFNVSASITYPAPPPFPTYQYPASETNATAMPPAGLNLVSGETAKKNIGDLTAGTSANVTWTVQADSLGVFTISVEAEGKVTGSVPPIPPSYPDGYTYTDRIGGSGQSIVAVTSKLDKTTPITFDDYDGSWRTRGFTINLTSTDDPDGSGVMETYYRINDGPTKTVSADGQPLITTEGVNNKLEYWSEDYAGNEESPHHILTGIKLDKTAPKGTITINSDDVYTTSTSVMLTLSATDATSGVYQVRYSNDGVWDTEQWEDFSATKFWTLTPSDDTHAVYFQIKDNAGLVSITYSDTIILDTTPPTGFITINNEATCTTTTIVTLTVSANDTTSGIAWMRFSNDNITYTNWEGYYTDPETDNASIAWTLKDGDGSKTVYVQFKDQVGLISTHSATITLDSTPPTGSITIEKGAIYTNSTSITLTLSANDTTSGVAQMHFSNDNTTWTVWEAYSISEAWPLTTGDGTKTVYVQFKDNVGLTSSTYQDTITLDTEKPTVNAGADQTVSEDTIVTFDGSASTDENSIASFTWTFIDIKPQTLDDRNPTYDFTTPGTYTITLKVTDPAGNYAMDNVTIIVLDITKPAADAGSDRTVNEDVAITLDGSASSDNVGITTYTWTFTDVITKTLTGEKPTYTFNMPSVYTIILNVTDAAGNWAKDTVIITVLDITPPIADAGQNQTVNVGATVVFDSGGSTDNVDITSYEWNFGDGTTGTGKAATHAYESSGTYTATLTVKDAANNTATDSITVTVRSTEVPPPPPQPVEAFPIWIIGAVIIVVGMAVGATLLWRRRK